MTKVNRTFQNILSVLILMASLSGKAQTLSIPFSATQTSPALTFSLDSNGVFMATGTENGTAVLTSGEEGAGTRFLWYPGKGALRAGTAVGVEWNDPSIGVDSVAFGSDVTASGDESVAIGNDCSATNTQSIAIGNIDSASGNASVAMGGATISSGIGSIALGIGSTATAWGATALGSWTLSTGPYSLASGWYATASGNASTALGQYTQCSSNASVAMGQFNIGGGSVSAWVSTDPLLELGNGASATERSDAFVVYKNGSATFAGPVTVPQSGDIPMFTGN